MMLTGATADAQTAAINKSQASLQRIVDELNAKFAGRTFRGADVVDELKRSFEVTFQFEEQAQSMGGWFGSLTDSQIGEIQDIGNDLLETYSFFKGVADGAMAPDYPASYLFIPGSDYWNKALTLQKAPIQWLAGIQKIVLTNQRNIDEAIDSAKNIPSASIRWTLEQLFKGLGLPTWLVPAMGVTALVGVGAWAYFSFLAPVGSVGRLVRARANPRRKRRVYRRRHAV